MMERRWTWRVAILFVLATLVLLVIVPYVVQERVTSLRARIELSEPARTLVMQWQFDLVREIAALNELLLTGDSIQTAIYDQAFAEETHIQERLAAMVPGLGSDVQTEFTEARTLAAQWHARVNEDIVLSAGTVDQPDLLHGESDLFVQTLRSVREVDDAIQRHTSMTRRTIAETERLGLVLTVVLGMLALISAAAVIAIGVRVRGLAAEAERQRSEADTALEESERLAEARTRLLRGITHDVKNPLGAAKGYAELLAMEIKGPLSPEQKPLVDGIERSVDSALAIIADLLDLARADSGVRVRREELSLDAFLRDAVEDYRVNAAHTGHEIEAVLPDHTPTVHTDPIRLRQVLDNLLSNALKYTPAPGRVEVRTRVLHDPHPGRKGEWVVIEVADSGPGIPVEHREMIFDEFTRLHEDSPVKGHGLGLPTARALARQLNGDLTIEDAEQGATFAIWIPQRDEAAPAGSRDRRRAASAV
jgi:signal transduction histidine kinase